MEDKTILDVINEFFPKANVVLMLWIFILIAVLVDLVAGVWKAKALNYIITSDGLKRTVNKLVQYYLLMTFSTMMDVTAVASEWLQLPYVSILLCLFILFIEGKSVFERADEKARKNLANGAKEVTTILASKEDFIKSIDDYIKTKSDDKNETK